MNQPHQKPVLEQQPQSPLTDVVGQCIDGQDRGGFLLLSLQHVRRQRE